MTNHEGWEPYQDGRVLGRALNGGYPRWSKLFILWEQRFGWACVVSYHDMWRELPIEVNRIIVDYLVERRYLCIMCTNTMPTDSSGLCSTECKIAFNNSWDNYTIIRH